MEARTVASLIGVYLLAVYTIAMCGAFMLAYCPFRIQHEGYIYVYETIDGPGERTYKTWSLIDTNSAWYKFGAWLLFPPGCLFVALPVTLLSSKEVFKW